MTTATGPLPPLSTLAGTWVRRRSSAKLRTMRDEITDDAELMLRFGRGEALAFEALYATHRGPLWRYVLRRVRDPAAAADLFQEIWLRVVAHAPRYRPTAKFATWLYRIADHACIDFFRARQRQQRRLADDADMLEELPDGAMGPEDEAAAIDRRDALEGALAALPAEQQSAFLMYVEAGLSIEEIAGATGVGTETAKSRLRYAVAKLKAALGDLHMEKPR